KVVVNLETHDAEAVGNVKITQKDAYFTGDRIIYNFESRRGSVTNGYLNARPFYGRAEDLAKVADKDEYSMNNGYVTTCDYDKPHYRIQAQQVTLYLDEKIVAKNVLFLVGDFPIAWLPYYVQPLGKERKTHITVIPGQSKDWGYYALTAYRYYINDDSKGDALLDYRSKKGLAVGVNHYLNNKDIGKGAFKFYYTEENNNLAFDKSGEQLRRYRYQYRHRWDMKDLDTSAIVEFNYLSDPDVIKDYFYNEYEELGSHPDNYISVVTAKRDYTTQLLFRKRFNKFYDVVERLPEYKIDILNYKIMNTNFYYTANASGVYLNHAYPATVPPQKDVSTIRFDAYNEISYAARFFKAVSVRPYAGVRTTYYSRNKWGDTNLTRVAFSEGVDASMKLYKVYDVESNFMGLDIHKLRHVITPSAKYYHTHQPTISPDNLNQFDNIDAIDTANGIKLALENRLQTKRGEADNMKSVDLATLIVSTDYMFRLKQDSLALKSNKFDGIDFRLELIPYSWLYSVATAHVNTKKYLIDQMAVDIVAHQDEKWSVAAGLRYEDTESLHSTLVTMDIRYKINDKWSLRAYERFDLFSKKLEEMQYTISRDLHCWIAELTYSIGNNLTTQGLYFVMKLKAFPDYPIGLQQTYSKPSFGQAGREQ
ncbi:MAG: hypothetical protein NC933_01710, partial [Candidatus Omnitrophica bacterium]|nr:hypothetical protein [Candidatus Omnitrophota bacterium]